jgi:hypothetical protein
MIRPRGSRSASIGPSPVRGFIAAMEQLLVLLGIKHASAQLSQSQQWQKTEYRSNRFRLDNG